MKYTSFFMGSVALLSCAIDCMDYNRLSRIAQVWKEVAAAGPAKPVWPPVPRQAPMPIVPAQVVHVPPVASVRPPQPAPMPIVPAQVVHVPPVAPVRPQQITISQPPRPIVLPVVPVVRPVSQVSTPRSVPQTFPAPQPVPVPGQVVRPVPTPRPAMRECPICMGDKVAADFCRLTCGHEFCRECLNTMLDSAVSGRNSTTLQCPNPTCRHPFTEGDVVRVTRDRNVFTTFLDIKLQEFLATNPTSRHCQTVNCPFVFEYTGHPELVICPGCHQQYCSNCLTAHPNYTTCEQTRAEREAAEARAAQERRLAADPDAANRASEQWKREHTKPCPSCHKNIEKNKGCNHMTCERGVGGCGYQFCWICMGPWDKHGNNYYQCNFQRPVVPQQEPILAAVAAAAATTTTAEQEEADRRMALALEQADREEVPQETPVGAAAAATTTTAEQEEADRRMAIALEEADRREMAPPAPPIQEAPVWVLQWYQQ